MKHIVLCIIFATGLSSSCLLFSGCGGEPFTYTPSNEVKPGPGLFSGPDGEFTLVGSDKDEGETEEPETSQDTE